MSNKFFIARCAEGRAVATGYVMEDEACERFIKSLVDDGMVVEIQSRNKDHIEWCCPDVCSGQCARAELR